MIARAALPAWLRRPAVLALFSLVALAALLSGGLVVAHAVDGTPTADASPSPAAGGNGDSNAAVGVNTKDRKAVYAIRLKIVQVSGDTVDASNAAAAVNSGCNGCSTVAVAFEGVLVAGTPSDFEPDNLALAMNVDCSGCTAFADAYQKVVQRSTRVRITGAGRQRVAAIRHDLDSLRRADLTLDAVVARVKADEQAFADVLLNDCVPIGHVTEPAPSSAPDVSDSPSTGTPSSQPAGDATPAASADPSPSDPPSEQSSPSSAPSPSASPTP